MVDRVKQRPNHYELLGVAQSAGSDEIAQAFAKELGMLPLRPFGSLAQVSLAYETLRDPIKRVAYDASLRPKAEPGHSLIGRLESSPFIGRAPVQQETAHPHLAHRSAASATEMPRRPAEPVRRETSSTTAPTPIAEPSSFKTVERLDQNESASVNWRLPALAGGALALAVVLGAWTGWNSGNDNEQAPPDRLAAVETPAPVPPIVDPAPSSSETQVAEGKEVPGPRRVLAKPRTARERPPLNIEMPQERPAKLPQADPTQFGQSVTEEASAEATPAPATLEKLPLPDATIARTIGRIGYACGSVSSTSAIEGARGVFKVTCTSGHSYRAAPVRGRYHFRRMGRD